MTEQEFQRFIDAEHIKRAINLLPMNLLRVARLAWYQFTDDKQKIRSLKNRYQGERCFILGNGPSLSIDDLNLLAGKHCFAFNRIYETFEKTQWRPEFYMVLDNDVMKTVSQNLDKLDSKYKFLNVMSKMKYGISDDSVIFFCSFGPYRVKECNYVKKRISKDISRYISLNYSVVGAAIETAIYFGFKEIILVGMDHNYSRYIDADGVGHCDDSVRDYSLVTKHDFVYFLYVDALESCLRCYRKYCENNGIRIVNATRGGNLEVLKRADLDQILSEGM